jgi:rhodanese-related sulfurtransferase
MADDKTISRDDLKRKIEGKENFLLVETLPAEKFNQAHLPGALNVPPEQLKQLAPQLLPDKNAEIVVYCSSPT